MTACECGNVGCRYEFRADEDAGADRLLEEHDEDCACSDCYDLSLERVEDSADAVASESADESNLGTHHPS